MPAPILEEDPDIELGPEEIDSQESQLRDDQLSRPDTIESEEYSLESQTADSELQSCSTIDKTYLSNDETASAVDYRLQSTDNTSDEDLEIKNDNINSADTDLSKEVPDGQNPLHLAILNGDKVRIKLLLKKKPNLLALTSKNKEDLENSETILDMIIHNVPEPTKFLKEVLDSYITLDGSSTNKVTVEYKILMPTKSLKKEMDVIEKLLKTGNEYDQQKLLLHPLIESFIYLKWQAVRPYYFQIALLHLIYMILLTTYTLSVFYFKDTYKTIFKWYNLIAPGFVIFLCIIVIILQELLMNLKKSRRKLYCFKWRNWVQIISLPLASSLPLALLAQELWRVEWPRHVATLTLLLTWVQMLIILSQYPRWGYYVVMFEKVAFNVIKIFGTFFFLIFGFAVVFMIQFRSQAPFDGVWNAFVKTLFMLVSEFEYNEVFKSENTIKLGLSFQVELIRIIFIVYLILVAIVLVNMMVGVAVDDIKDLKSHGDIGRLEKQADFVSALDTFDYNLVKKVLHIPDKNRPKYLRQLFPPIIKLGNQNSKTKTDCYTREMPKRLQEAFFIIAEENKEEEENQKSKDVKLKEERRKFKKQCDYCDYTLTRIDKLEATMDKKLDLLRKEILILKQLAIK